MEAFGLTDRGKVRNNNQDSILLDRGIGLFIVADGMGGHACGEVASELAVRTANRYLQEQLVDGRSETQETGAAMTTLLKNAFHLAHEAILDESQKLPEGQIMGTTMSLALIKANKIYLAHIGDSRIYRLRTGRLEKLTKDHTEVQGLVDMGLIGEEEAENHRLSHVLTRVLGVVDKDRPDVLIVDAAPGDRLLLSSDGLFRELSLGEVEEIMAANQPAKEKCAILITRVLDCGARDNVSIIVLEL
jgi:PPM family protein phosphatase